MSVFFYSRKIFVFFCSDVAEKKKDVYLHLNKTQKQNKMEKKTIAQVQTEMVSLEEKFSQELLHFDEYNQERIRLNREMYSLKMNQQFEFICQTWNYCPVTFKRIGVEEKIIVATSEREAKMKLDRHESVIKSIRRR